MLNKWLKGPLIDTSLKLTPQLTKWCCSTMQFPGLEKNSRFPLDRAERTILLVASFLFVFVVQCQQWMQVEGWSVKKKKTQSNNSNRRKRHASLSLHFHWITWDISSCPDFLTNHLLSWTLRPSHPDKLRSNPVQYGLIFFFIWSGLGCEQVFLVLFRSEYNNQLGTSSERRKVVPTFGVWLFVSEKIFKVYGWGTPNQYVQSVWSCLVLWNYVDKPEKMPFHYFGLWFKQFLGYFSAGFTESTGYHWLSNHL